MEVHAELRGLGFGGQRGVLVIGFDEGFAGLDAVRQLERVSHRAADENGVGLFQQTVNDLDLVGNFCAAKDDYEWPGRFFQFITKEFQFALHQQTRRALAAALSNDAGDTFRRSMSAMRRAERVVHINISNFREFFGEGGIIFFLFVVVTDIFEQQHVAGFHDADGFFNFFADAIVHEGDVTAEQVGEFHGDGTERHRRLALALGPTEVRGEDELAALFDEKLERGQGLDDAGGIVDDHLAVFFFHRHVVIHADKDAFAPDIQIANCQFCHKSKAPKNRSAEDSPARR